MSDQLTPNENPQDELSTPLKVLSFCAPMVGAIIYFTSKDQTPKKAKSACTLSIWGAVIITVLAILFSVLGIIGGIASAAANSGGY